jgi:ribosomal-protein-serine acetyltransferase
MSSSPDKVAIDAITKQFFELFTNVGGRTPDLQTIYALFIPEGIVIKNVNGNTETFSLSSFIEPRQKILTDGTLSDFQEHELTERTDIAGAVAQRFCTYKNSGFLNDQAFETHGVKTIQFIKTQNTWRITSVAWDDF